MKIAPLSETNPWYSRILADDRIQTDTLTGVPVETTVDVELVELLHGGPEDNYRPYLHLRGELTEAQPVVQLPYGVSDLALRRGSGVPVDAFYDFSHAQLADLVAKGYFSPAFRVPEEMSGIPWTLPAKANFLVVAPALAEEPPVVFMSIHQQTGLELDEANSGYELSAYFPDYTAEASAALDEGRDAIDAAPRTRGTSAFDVFAAEGFEVETTRAVVAQQASDEVFEAARATVPDGVFSRLVKEIQAQQPAEVETSVPDEEAVQGPVPGSAEEVYLSRVSPGVDHVLSGEHLTADDGGVEAGMAEAHATTQNDADTDQAENATVATPAETPSGFIDFGEPEEDLEPLQVQFGGISEDDHRRALERRQARLRAELVDSETQGSPDADGAPHPAL